MTEKSDNDKIDSLINPFWEELKNLQNFREVVIGGYESAALSTRIYNLMQDSPNNPYAKLSEEQRKHEKLKREEIVAYANKEKETDFSYLNDLAVTRLWGILEAMVDGVVLYQMKNHPEILENENFRKIKVPIVEFLKLSKDDQMEFLLEKLKAEVNSGLKVGLGQFKVLLDPIGLTGKIPDQISKLILELQQSRHLIAHTNGKIDNRFLVRCPWLNLVIGDKLRISPFKFHQYYLSVLWLQIELDRRLKVKEGIKIKKMQIELLADFLSKIDETENKDNSEKTTEKKP